MINKDKFLGQVAVVENGIWLGRKLVKENFHKYSECLKKAEALANNKAKDAHITIFFSDEPLSQYANYIGDFLIDLDGEDLRKVLDDAQYVAIFLMELKFPFSVSFSSNKGFKFYIPFEAFGINPTPVLPELYKEFAGYIAIKTQVETIDFKVYHYRHMNRIDNTIHPKTGLFQVPIAANELLSNKDVSYFKEVATSQRPKVFEPGEIPVESFKDVVFKVQKFLASEERKRRERAKIIKEKIENFTLKGDIRTCVSQMLKNGAKLGERNEMCLRLAQEFVNLGLNYAFVLEEVKNWNALNEPPLQERELESVVASAFRHRYSFGCNDYLLKTYCGYENRKECPYYSNFVKIAKADISLSEK